MGQAAVRQHQKKDYIDKLTALQKTLKGGILIM